LFGALEDLYPAVAARQQVGGEESRSRSADDGNLGVNLASGAVFGPSLQFGHPLPLLVLPVLRGGGTADATSLHTIPAPCGYARAADNPRFSPGTGTTLRFHLCRRSPWIVAAV
jgi:hypothetical protein